jgi:lipopolysaccharide export system protein LptA
MTAARGSIASGRAFAVLLLGLCLSANCALAKGLAKESVKGGAVHGQSSAGGGGLDFADQKSGTPLEVYADQGLELSQDAKTVIGRGNAKAIRGRVTVTADVLIAHYRDKGAKAAQPAAVKQAKDTEEKQAKGTDEAESSSEVWRVEADGHVKIFTATQTAYGDHADYNIDDAVVVLTGKDLRMVTPTDTVTAKDSLEYWEHRQQAVARGKAEAVRDDKSIKADILVADFGENRAKQMAMQRAHGYDNVVLTTEREVVTGDRADYDAESGIVTVSGSVKMTRDNNQLNGGYAVVNLNSGISRLYPVAPGGAVRGKDDHQVKGLFVPQKKSESGGRPAKPDAKSEGGQ